MRALAAFGLVIAMTASAHADNWVGASFDVGAGMHAFDGPLAPMTSARFAIRFPLGIYLAYTLETGRVLDGAPTRLDGKERDRVRAATIALGLRREMGVVSFAGDLGMGDHLFFVDEMDARAQDNDPRPKSAMLHGEIDVWLTRYTTLGAQIGAAVVGDREQMFTINAGVHFGDGRNRRAVFALPWERSAAGESR